MASLSVPYVVSAKVPGKTLRFYKAGVLVRPEVWHWVDQKLVKVLDGPSNA